MRDNRQRHQRSIICNGERLESMTVHMRGLNLILDIAMVTKHLTGIVKNIVSGGKKMEFPLVSYHVCSSEAGANASDKHGNAVITSHRLNLIERSIWNVLLKNGKTVIGENDFQMLTKIKTGPLVPKDFSRFFKEMNEAREVQGRSKIPDTKREDLRAMLNIQEKEQRAYRVEEHVYHIIKHKDGLYEVNSFKLPRDYDLYVPEDGNKIPNRSGSKA